ncbi:hypothetical protein NQ315_015393 [Exocentrus adspersus]|uniref:Reverse transcriptase zinc-binding domain-containing protein n=1 Tax=Exocentrus adspersus TaxID=1586481 RepID=A0AAV8V9L0_9CUCU|nr:hypothetical protein NQ315_015393 [Exocentrus adspersus]
MIILFLLLYLGFLLCYFLQPAGDTAAGRIRSHLHLIFGAAGRSSIQHPASSTHDISVLDGVLGWCELEQMSLEPPCGKGYTEGETVAMDVSLYLVEIIGCQSWGMGPKQLHCLYTMAVRPMVVYDAIASWTKATAVPISFTPSAALEILLDLPPLHIYLESEARWAIYRNRQLAINLPQTNIMEHSRMLEGIESHSVLGMVSDGLPARINLDLPYNIPLPERDEWEQNRTDLLRADSCWYTDSSKTTEGAGAQDMRPYFGRRYTPLNCGRELESRAPIAIIRIWAEGDILQYWRGLPGLTHSKRFIPPPSKARSKKLLELSRINLRALVGLYTGHCRLRHHMHRIGLAEDAEYRLCMEDDETAEHVLYTCPAADRTRFLILGKVQLMPEYLDKYSPGKIIDFLRRLELLGEV